MTKKYAVTVLGGGSFGTALASIAADNGYPVQQWMRDQALADHINLYRCNNRYLPDYVINENVQATTDVVAAVSSADIIFVAIPSKAFAAVVDQAEAYLRPDQVMVSTAKGIQEDGFLLMSEILRAHTPSQHIGVLSGPNLAKEIAQKQLTATVVASDDAYTRSTIQQVLSCSYFRVYASNDLFGVELGGALKNIYAIAAGMASALGVGENTKSMLITRSLAEMSRFAVAMGANPMTFLGLSGVGDLIVTCMSPLSRNFRVGYALGEGQSLDHAVEQLGQVAEGVNTIRLVRNKALEMGVYMPLACGLYEVLFNNLPVSKVIHGLMTGEQSTDVEFVLPR
ncbi:glycerol 3-phosphate dehydrogenase (NAD(P)+) [Oceanospirillum multiglobuliferum]|uniref:Glycerol-3-phosphate dehydrogenase [NAD(P)+] n=1 Tax=Oceanospirillum multiglobuliferum TaxID=64969 RepID=A0A1T4N2W4_9GAMM|nr:NAD(P)H-dependent glycerol-3-phosphate dehydrogenase [Oceanospirillum multiglobuliferum]OPX55812.1 glycerol-3-phosphate dehydrogenase [Oceanospirillum multiglobuliferum]SJZ73446.1 glycerol 3-phosphate dehydrogenase (NAD(P)+) [Oceanospirillum multiglobuliferum]